MPHSMPHLPTDFPLPVWPRYEPAGHRVELTEADLVQHILLIGSTGSGKSSGMNPNVLPTF